MYIATVTQKGQVTLPKEARERLGIKLRGKVSITVKKDNLQITPAYTSLDLAGKFKAPKGMDALKAREYMETHYDERV